MARPPHLKLDLFSLKLDQTAYFVSLGLAEDEASTLHMQYYTQYGLALAGLVRHHQIGNCSNIYRSQHFNTKTELDPLDFDRKCDGSLPLEDMIKPNPAIRTLLQDIDRSKVRVWALTNANKPVGFSPIHPSVFVNQGSMLKEFYEFLTFRTL